MCLITFELGDIAECHGVCVCVMCLGRCLMTFDLGDIVCGQCGQVVWCERVMSLVR